MSNYIDLGTVEQWCDAQEELLNCVEKIKGTYTSSNSDPWRQSLFALRFMIEKAPFHVGDIVKISEEIKCEDGWVGFEETLALGQLCDVRSVSVYDGKFNATVTPIEQWCDVYESHNRTGQRTLLTKHRKSFSLSEKSLEKVLYSKEWDSIRKVKK